MSEKPPPIVISVPGLPSDEAFGWDAPPSVREKRYALAREGFASLLTGRLYSRDDVAELAAELIERGRAAVTFRTASAEISGFVDGPCVALVEEEGALTLYALVDVREQRSLI